MQIVIFGADENVTAINIPLPTISGGGGTPSWADITDKPTTFPPAAHTHAIADVTGLQAALDGKAAAAGVQSMQHLGVAQGSADAIVLDLPPSTFQPGAGNTFSFTAAFSNTGPATIAVGSRAAVPLRRPSGDPLSPGDIAAGETYFAVINPMVVKLAGAAERAEKLTRAAVNRSVINLGATTGEANAYVGTIPADLPITAISAGGVLVSFRPHATNTGPSTLTVSNASRIIRHSDGTQVAAGELAANRVYTGMWGPASLTLAGDVDWDRYTAIMVALAALQAAGNATPKNSDAGFTVLDEEGGVLLDAGPHSTTIGGRAEPLQESLRKLEWRGVRAEATAMPWDVTAMFDPTPAAARRISAGLALRGGAGAPVPAWQIPVQTPIGHTWLTSDPIKVNWGDPMINADPFYYDNRIERSFVHPYVSFFPQRFMGYLYLMVVNPYPQSQALLENPVLYGSQNMQDWDLLSHIQQPLAWGEDYMPAASGTYLSDPGMTYNPLTRELIIFWRQHIMGGMFDEHGHSHRIVALTTLDGINWSAPVEIQGETGDGTTLLCPIYVYNPSNDLWYSYTCRDPEWEVRTKRDLFDPSEPWSAPIDLGVNGWHGEFRVVGDKVWFFQQTNTLWYYHLWLSDPNDWTRFTKVSTGNGIIDASDFASHTSNQRAYSYKSTFVPHLYPDGTANMKALIQTKRPENEWWLFFKETARKPYAS